MKKLIIATGMLFMAATGCKKYEMPGNTPTTNPILENMIRGADVSWITEMEAAGLKFYDTTGKATDGFQLMKDINMNAIRLRVWVNPAKGYNNTADVVAKAARAHKLGMQLLIDFHYSDTWADPGHQTTPAAWANQDIAGLQTSVYDHTKSVLTALKDKGIIPVWVQVGNETNNGMLWPLGKASDHMDNFALLINAGYKAVKEIDANIKVIVHISNGFDNGLFRWMFDGLTENKANFDIIGMSLYPSTNEWQTPNQQCEVNMKDMISRYNKEIMLCEVGMPASSPVATNYFIRDLYTRLHNLPDGKGLGIFYWEPQAYNRWENYGLGAFDATGRPTFAMDAFR
ncbi:glycoside hydrolase family 53 protein [Chitinophaga rhizophila]|uniref:Arabinogalactan endo-beta-1,4-galactanase n=1 Tax=Chitinophaga rhizophila TaxID=2866212 RepID=A0ABS7GE51_9BACT|nr:glycosyl hydrolase 53 family protein [Chitinophaga rhizophila]MBW8684808.1 arabinogalactan endo-1,4-beta-galactosidase [Chitinophaga rhizophila]